MSLCINDDLIWVSIPRCGSFSIEESLIMHPQLDVKHFELKCPNTLPLRHIHVRLDALYKIFGNRDTVCIKRDWFDCWLSALGHIWFMLEINGFTPKVKFKDVDNEYIYNTFNIEFYHKLITNDMAVMTHLISELITEDISEIPPTINQTLTLAILQSQNYWKFNEPCTYEFDFNEFNKFEKFIENRYGVSFKLNHINKRPKQENKIIINDDFKSYIWDLFEKPFDKEKNVLKLI